MAFKYYRTFKQRGVGQVKDMPIKKNRKSTFRQLAATKKYECKILSEYLISIYEQDYQFNY